MFIRVHLWPILFERGTDLAPGRAVLAAAAFPNNALVRRHFDELLRASDQRVAIGQAVDVAGILFFVLPDDFLIRD